MDVVKGLFSCADNRQEGTESVNEIVAVNLSGDASLGTLLEAQILPLLWWNDGHVFSPFSSNLIYMRYHILCTV